MSEFRICYPVSVGAVILNSKNEILLFAPPDAERWRCISGWVEQESLLEAIHREITEETGLTDYRVLDVIDAHTFVYQHSPIISVWYGVHYLSGSIQPADDLQNYRFMWFNESDMAGLQLEIPDKPEIIRKAFRILPAKS